MKENLRTILKEYHISITRPRLEILKVFLQTNGALTYNHFLAHSSLQLNRVTVFRTLNLFTKKNIIHRIPAADNVNRYLLQQTSTIVHSNFMCNKCKKIIPLKTIIPPKVSLPEGCIQENIGVIVSGLCASCK